MTERQHALAIAFPGCAYLEIATAVAWLRDHVEVLTASPDGGVVPCGDAPRLSTDLAFGAARVRRPSIVLVPGGNLDAVCDDEALVALLAGLHADGALIAGICNGGLVLARAGLLRGRRCTHTCVDAYAPRPAWDPLRDWADPWLAGSEYVDEPVVVDGRVITAKPWAAIDYASRVLIESGLATATEAARRASYVRGHPIPVPR